MMLERRFEVDHTQLYRWVQHYAPEIEKRLRWCYKPTIGRSRRVDEAYVKIKGKCPKDTVHRQVKYLNNIVEVDHGKLKRLINPVRGFKTMKTAYATIKGFEIICMFKKGKMSAWMRKQGLIGEIRFIERQLYTYTA